MLPTLYVGYLVTMSSIFVLNVHSQSENCGYVSTTDSAKGDWPWMVAITKKMKMSAYLNDSLVCNGFLIDRRHVLTAARCPYPKDGLENLTVRIGKKNWYEGQEHKITCITRHPRFDRGQVYDDIAILRLSRDVDMPNYAPICLPDDNLRMKRLDGLTVVKPLWGYFGNGTLQFARLRIISNRNCTKILSRDLGSYHYEFPGAVSSDMLCTVNPTDQWEPCYGSSGAPVMYKDNSNKWIAVGMDVLTFRCNADSPRGNIRISEYVEWIEESTRSECS